MYFKTSDGIKLSYQDTATSRQPIIFLSGYSGIKEEWINQIKFFEKNFRVITMDHRNHGASAVTHTGLRISRLGQDLFELIEELSLKKVILVGHSMGSAVIWAYLSLHGDSNLRKIVFVDESPKTLNDDNWNYGALNLTWNNVIMKATDIEQTKMTFGRIDNDLFQLLKDRHSLYLFNSEINKKLLINHLVQDWRDIVTTTNVPQLFIGSEHSPIWSPGFIEECLKLVPVKNESQAYIFHKSGHLPHMEETELFNEVVEKFIK